jgi:hypothetical protein
MVYRNWILPEFPSEYEIGCHYASDILFVSINPIVRMEARSIIDGWHKAPYRMIIGTLGKASADTTEIQSAFYNETRLYVEKNPPIVCDCFDLSIDIGKIINVMNVEDKYLYATAMFKNVEEANNFTLPIWSLEITNQDTKWELSNYWNATRLNKSEVDYSYPPAVVEAQGESGLAGGDLLS